MNKLYRLLFVIFWLSLCNMMHAQDGTIRGTVIDAANGESLIGVNILVVGTSTGTSTDIEGEFDLKLPAGTYDLRISYISYASVTIEGVEVTGDEVTVLDNILLQQATEELEEVVVTTEAINISEAALLTKKKKSANLLDGISAENIKKTGVSDAAEALKKVTGVTIQGGKYVYVRGLGDRYTNTMLNTVEIPSLDPNRNSLQIDIFPTNLIDNMVISKTAVAEMPADFTGGIVNIQTKDFPERPIFDISASANYNPSMHFNNNYLTYGGSGTDFLGFDNGARKLPDGARGNIPFPNFGSGADNTNVYNFVNSFNSTLGPRTTTNNMDYSLSASLGNQYNLGNNYKIGYIISGTYKKSTKHYDDYRYGEWQLSGETSENELVRATTQQGVVSEGNVLVGGLAGIALKTARSKYKLTGMHLQNGQSRSTHFFIDNSQSAPGQSGYLGESYNLEYGERGISNILLNGTHYFEKGSWEVDWRLSPTFSSMDDPDIRNTTYTLRGDPENPIYIFNAGAGGFPSRLWRTMDEVNLVGRANVSKEYELWGEAAKFKFGGSYVYKQRDYEILQFDLSGLTSSNAPTWTGNPSEILVDENIFGNGNGGFIYMQSGNPIPNPNKYSSNVNNIAFYASNEFNPLTDLKVSLGLRAENYVQRHTGQAASGGEDLELDNEKVLDALDLFPSANLTYFLTDAMNMRFSYSRTIARPSFRELSFAQILDPVSDRRFNGGLFPVSDGQGNMVWDGNLRETRIQNFDVRWETYFQRDELLSLSVFYKTFDAPLELVRLRTSPTSSEYQPRNVGDGQVYGAEVELRKSFNFISPSLDNFGFNGNITVVKSLINMTDDEFEARIRYERDDQSIVNQRDMAGQAPYVINAGLTYEKPEIGLDAGFFYNVKGKTLIVVGGGIFPDVYSQPFHSLNFNLNKSIGAFSASLNISNILNDVRKEFYEAYRAPDQIYSRYSPQSSVSLGVKYNF